MTVAVAIALLASATYALRAGGLLLPNNNPHIERFANPITAAILASLVITSSLTIGTAITLDARAVGLAVAGIAAIGRLPLTITLILAVVATAITRLVT